MKFSEVQLGDRLWNTTRPGMFLVVMVSEGGLFVVDLFSPDKGKDIEPIPLALILPRDSEEWVIDKANTPLTEEQRNELTKAIDIWEALNH